MKLKELMHMYSERIRKEKGLPDESISDQGSYAKEERAAIMEFDGELSREKAEEEAEILANPINNNSNDFGNSGCE